LISLIQAQAQVYKFDGADKLRFVKKFETIGQKLEFIRGLLAQLAVE
jgi:transcription-repair coupling factor (superfamily II helicase)